MTWSRQVVDRRPGRRRRAQLRRGQRLHRARRASPTPTPRPSTSREVLGVSAGDVVVCSTGLIGELLPMAEAARRGRRRGRRRCPPTVAPAPPSAIMTTDTVHKHGRRPTATAGPSAAWPRARACSPPPWRRCSSVVTTDAVVGDGSARRRPAVGHRDDLRPGRLRRLPVDQRHRGPARVRRVGRRRRTPTSSRPPVDRGLREPRAPARRRRRGRPPRHRHRGALGGQRGRRARGGPLGRAQQPVQVRGLRQRPQLGPRARRRRHHRRRRSTRTSSTSRSTASRSAGPAAWARTARSSTSPPREVHVVVDLHAGDAVSHRSGPTTSPTTTSTRTRPTPAEDRADRRPTATDPPSTALRGHIGAAALRVAQRQGPDPGRGAALARAVPWARSSWSSTAATPWSTTSSRRPSPRTSPSCATRAASRRRARRWPADRRRCSTGSGSRASSRAACGSPTPEVMDVVRMVLTGQVGRELVGLLNQHGPVAVGLSGEDAGLFGARRRGTEVDGEEVDLGLVGDVVHGRTPAPCRTSSTPAGSRSSRPSPRPRRRRTGAQHQRRHRRRRARRRARRPQARHAHRRRGRLRRLARPRLAARRRCRSAVRRDLLGRVDAGMIPKLEACVRAVENGVPQAHVIDGRQPHSLLLEVFTSEGIGTMVVPDAEAATSCRNGRRRLMTTAQRRAARALRGARSSASSAVRRWCSTTATAAGSGTSTAGATSTCVGGIAVNALGHDHPALVAAISKQAGRGDPRLEPVHLARRRSPSPSGSSARRTPPRARRSSSPTPAPRPSRPPSSWAVAPAAAGSSLRRVPSTAAPRARWRSPTRRSTASRSRRSSRGRATSRYGDEDALRAAVDRADGRRGPRADPG